MGQVAVHATFLNISLIQYHNGRNGSIEIEAHNLIWQSKSLASYWYMVHVFFDFAHLVIQVWNCFISSRCDQTLREVSGIDAPSAK